MIKPLPRIKKPVLFIATLLVPAVFVLWFSLSKFFDLARFFAYYEKRQQDSCIVTENLVALKQRTSLEGSASFFIFVGTAKLGENYYFYFYSGSEEEGYKLREVSNSSNEVVIFEDSNINNARVTITKGCRYPSRYEFHVPRGSIERNFNLSL